MKKIIPVVVALALILIIGSITVGGYLVEKYSYSKERADLTEYFGVQGDEIAIFLQDERLDATAVLKNGICYLDLDTIKVYFNDIFYVDKGEQILLYTTPTEIIRVAFGSTVMSVDGEETDLGYEIAYSENDTVYIAIDYVAKYTNMSYEVFGKHMQIYNEWGEKTVANAIKDTAVRLLGGIKSPILRDLPKDEQVEILEQMETWSKVKTLDSIVGYVENKLLTDPVVVQEVPVTDYIEPEYTTNQLDGKVCLGWHSIGGVGGNDTLDGMVAGTIDMNVIAPTWFSLRDNEGNFESFGSKAYVDRAHALGLEVWGVLDDFNYNNVHDAGIDVYTVLSSTTKRMHLVEGITELAVALGLDGINLDFEKVTAESGEHFVQFIRELSVYCRENDLTFSIDSYVPFNFNSYLRRDVQGQVADYVIIMGYDEHWHGSGDAGSVASIDYVSNGIDKTLEQVPKEKVVNALPFYTILWKIDGANVTDEYLTLNNTQNFIDRIGVKGEWDEETQQMYYEWKSGSATYKLWAETEKSLGVKINVMKVRDIAGVAVWRLGYGTKDAWQMISAYMNAQ